jgi:hypothetical protein
MIDEAVACTFRRRNTAKTPKLQNWSLPRCDKILQTINKEK